MLRASRRRIIGGLAIAPLFAPATVRAQKDVDTLRVSWRDPIENVDPYCNALRTGLVIGHHAWDCLIYRDPDTLALKPLLALSWTSASDTAIEFKLRRGVVFHDGSPFTADDVVYTIDTVLADPSTAAPWNYAWLAGADKLDADTVRIKLKNVFPAALEYIAMLLPIRPKAYRERVGAEGYSVAPVGTGPYRIARVDGQRAIDLERFDGYFADSPKGRPAIRRIAIREVASATAELADLLDKRSDWIWRFTPAAFDFISQTEDLVAVQAESMRVGFLLMDAAGRAEPGGPLTNVKVRQAIALAIDRQTIAKQLMRGGVRVLDAPCYPTQFGCDASAAIRYTYAPAKARALLEDAGFKNGFTTDIVSLMLPSVGRAVQAYLHDVGIEARLQGLPAGAAFARIAAGKAPLALLTWGSGSINDVSAILPQFFGGGNDDMTRDPDLIRAVTAGGATTDPDKRRQFYGDAIHRMTQAADVLPMTTEVTTYAFSRMLNFRASPDEIPRFFLASWR